MIHKAQKTKKDIYLSSNFTYLSHIQMVENQKCFGYSWSFVIPHEFKIVCFVLYFSGKVQLEFGRDCTEFTCLWVR